MEEGTQLVRELVNLKWKAAALVSLAFVSFSTSECCLCNWLGRLPG